MSSRREKMIWTILIDENTKSWKFTCSPPSPHHKKTGGLGGKLAKIEPGEKEPEFKRKGRTNRKWGRRMGTGRKLSVHISWDVARDILVIKDTTTVHLWLRQWKQNVSGYSHFRIFVKIPKSLLLIVTLP